MKAIDTSQSSLRRLLDPMTGREGTSQSKLRRVLEPTTGREGWFTPAGLVLKNVGPSDCRHQETAGVNHPSRPVIAPRLDIARFLQRQLLTRPTRLSQLSIIVVFGLLLFSLPVSVSAQAWGQGPPPMSSETTSDGKPRMLEGVGIDQKLDAQLPLDLMFKDETGAQVRLADYFGKRPVVLALVYYSCPMLCNQVLNGLTGSMDTLAFDIGKEFEVVTVSFDPRETAELAREKKKTYIKWYKRPGASDGWHFLTGDKHEIDKLTEAVGFRYRYDPATNQFAHGSGIMIATPQGKLARYFYGIEYAPRDLKLGLIDASESKIGSPVDKLLLLCYHYDPAAGKYGPIVMNMIRLGGGATVIGFVLLTLWMRRRTAMHKRAGAGGTL